MRNQRKGLILHGTFGSVPLFSLYQLLESPSLHVLRFFPSAEDVLGDRDLKVPGTEQTVFRFFIPIIPVGAIQIEGGSPEPPGYKGDLGEYVAIPHPYAIGERIGADTPYDAWRDRVLIPQPG
jgi:hypothetical protein